MESLFIDRFDYHSYNRVKYIKWFVRNLIYSAPRLKRSSLNIYLVQTVIKLHIAFSEDFGLFPISVVNTELIRCRSVFWEKGKDE